MPRTAIYVCWLLYVVIVENYVTRPALAGRAFFLRKNDEQTK